MEQFIAMAAKKLNLETSAVEKALGIFFLVLHENAPPADFRRLITGLPEAEALLARAQSGFGSADGQLGSAASSVENAMGAGAWKLGAFAHWQAAGLDSAQLGELLELFEYYASANVDAELVQRLMEQVPNLDSLIG